MYPVLAAAAAALGGCLIGGAIGSSEKNIREAAYGKLFEILEEEAAINDTKNPTEILLSRISMDSKTHELMSDLLSDENIPSLRFLEVVIPYLKDRPNNWSIYNASMNEKLEFLEVLAQGIVDSVSPERGRRYLQNVAHQIGVSLKQLEDKR